MLNRNVKCKLIRFLVNESDKEVNATPSLIIKPIPNIINFTSFGFNVISSWLKISQVVILTFLTYCRFSLGINQFNCFGWGIYRFYIKFMYVHPRFLFKRLFLKYLQ